MKCRPPQNSAGAPTDFARQPGQGTEAILVASSGAEPSVRQEVVTVPAWPQENSTRSVVRHAWTARPRRTTAFVSKSFVICVPRSVALPATPAGTPLL